MSMKPLGKKNQRPKILLNIHHVVEAFGEKRKSFVSVSKTASKSSMEAVTGIQEVDKSIKQFLDWDKVG